MLQTSKGIAGSQPYKSFSNDALANALQAVADGYMSIRRASWEFNIPNGPLEGKVHHVHGGPNIKCLKRRL